MDVPPPDLRRLEARLRRLQTWTVALTAGLAVACLASSTGRSSDVLRARRFELVDAEGAVWGTMWVEDGDAGLVIRDPRDADAVRMVALGTGRVGAPTLTGDDGRELTWGVRGDAVASASLSVGSFSSQGSCYASLVASPDSAGLACAGEADEARCYFGVGREPAGPLGASLTLEGAGGELEATSAADGGGPTLRILDAEGNETFRAPGP